MTKKEMLEKKAMANDWCHEERSRNRLVDKLNAVLASGHHTLRKACWSWASANELEEFSYEKDYIVE